MGGGGFLSPLSVLQWTRKRCLIDSEILCFLVYTEPTSVFQDVDLCSGHLRHKLLSLFNPSVTILCQPVC